MDIYKPPIIEELMNSKYASMSYSKYTTKGISSWPKVCYPLRNSKECFFGCIGYVSGFDSPNISTLIANSSYF